MKCSGHKHTTNAKMRFMLNLDADAADDPVCVYSSRTEQKRHTVQLRTNALKKEDETSNSLTVLLAWRQTYIH